MLTNQPTTVFLFTHSITKVLDMMNLWHYAINSILKIFLLCFSRNIQDSEEGHCSVEDGKATMELVLHKLQNSKIIIDSKATMELVLHKLQNSKICNDGKFKIITFALYMKSVNEMKPSFQWKRNEFLFPHHEMAGAYSDTHFRHSDFRIQFPLIYSGIHWDFQMKVGT